MIDSYDGISTEGTPCLVSNKYFSTRLYRAAEAILRRNSHGEAE